MTESDLTALLSTRHSDDVFFAQVKNGPTYTASKLLILDGCEEMISTHVR